MRLTPASIGIDARERWRAGLGVFLGLLVTALSGSLWSSLAEPAMPLMALAAPMGASVIILFALPSSPLAQPWAILGGNTLSALVGVLVAQWVPHPSLAAALAVGAAIAVMFAARCLHPPGGAVALLAVLQHITTPLYALAPVLLNSAVLVAMAALYNTRTGRPYPHRPAAPEPERSAPGYRFTKADLDAALARYNEVVDINRDDLQALLHEAEAQAWQRTLGQLRCRQIMSANLVTMRIGDSLELAWERLNRHSIKALPVVDASGHVLGILTLADFVRRLEAAPIDANQAARSDPGLRGTVETLMTRRVRVATDTLRVLELLPLFSEGGHHHLPVIDVDKVLVGMITQSDVVRALHRTIGQPF